MPSSNPFRLTTALVIVMAAPLFADLASIRGLIRAGRFAAAVEECDRELKSSPRSVSLLTMKGLALQGAGDKAASLAALRGALSIDPTDSTALKAAAQIEFETRDSRARKTLESVLRQDPGAEAAHAMLAVLHFEAHECAPALAHFEKAPGATQSPAGRWQYGVCLFVQQRWQESAVQFSALLQLRDHPPTRFNLALAYWNAKNFPAAIATLEPMAGTNADADTLRLLSTLYEASADTAKAFSTVQRAIQRYPDDERLLVDLAAMCMDHGAYDLGIEVIETGVRNNPTSVRLQTLLGVLLVRSGNLDKGQEAFRRAQELSPEAGLGRIGLASTLMQMGMAADAVPILRAQLAEKGPDPRVELILVRAILFKSPSAEDTRESALLLRGILKREPGNAVAHGLLGKVYFQLGDTSEAAAESAAAIRLDPSDRTSTYQLMTIYQRTGRTREAAELARKVRLLLDQEKVEEDASNRFRLVRKGAEPSPDR